MPRFLVQLQLGPRLATQASLDPLRLLIRLRSNSSKVSQKWIYPFRRVEAASPGCALVSRYLRPYCQLGGKQWPHWTLEATSSSLLFQPQNVGRWCRMGPGTRTPATSTWHAGHGSDAGNASLAGDTL